MIVTPHLKHAVLPVFMATSLGLFSTPANAFSLRDTEHGESLFQVFNSLVNTESFRLVDEELNLRELRAESLRWAGGSKSVDIFFINEGAGFRNQLFLTANGNEPQMIFSDISSKESGLPEIDGMMALGYGKSLGGFSSDTSLDFLIKANGLLDPNGYIYGANPELNPDKLQHVVAYEYFDEVMSESWVILGFEDIYGEYSTEVGGSDRDFNDVVVAVKGAAGDSVETEDVPEPSAMLSLMVVSGLMGVTRRR
ncbi:MAG: DUF4114 domain-containing protein [Oscillatoriales cyanobacterium]|nr:MAG: DUF4114 domain-containing protein [Oscillatoriales cyanobacterium]